MKNVSTAISGLFLSAVLLTACSKNDNNMAVSPATTPGTSAKAVTTVLDFKSGGIAYTDFAILSRGKTIYQTDEPGSLNLFSNLADMGIRPLNYPDVTARINARANPGRAIFWLQAEHVLDGRTIPVLFSIEEPIEIRANHQNLAVKDVTNVMDLLNIKGDLLAPEITADMLMHAERAGEVIHISPRVNTDMYAMILENLRNMVQMSFIPGPTTPPVAATVAVPRPSR